MATKATKRLKPEDLRAKTEDELGKMLLDLKKQQMNLRFQQSGGQLANTSVVRIVRREIARIKTIVSAKKAGTDATPAKAAKPAAKTKAKKSAAKDAA